MDNKPTKEAYLRHDLYQVEERIIRHGFYSKENIPFLGEMILPKNTKFVYFETNPELEFDDGGWYDDVGYGIEGVGDEFAIEHLTKPIDL
jgi:hypothetical protein